MEIERTPAASEADKDMTGALRLGRKGILVARSISRVPVNPRPPGDCRALQHRKLRAIVATSRWYRARDHSVPTAACRSPYISQRSQALSTRCHVCHVLARMMRLEVLRPRGKDNDWWS